MGKNNVRHDDKRKRFEFIKLYVGAEELENPYSSFLHGALNNHQVLPLKGNLLAHRTQQRK